MDYRNAGRFHSGKCAATGLGYSFGICTRQAPSRAGRPFVATRGGLVEAHVRGHEAEEIAISMGVATMQDGAPEVSVALGERRWDAVAVSVPNPHAVVFVESLDADCRIPGTGPGGGSGRGVSPKGG